MSKKSTNTALILVGGGIVAYLIFKKSQTTTAATPAPGSPNALMSKASNLLTALFGGNNLPTSASGQAALVQQAANPDNVAVVDNTPSSVAPVTAGPAPSSGMSLDIQAPVYNTSDGATSEYISSDASLMDSESIGSYPTSWTGWPISSISGP